MVKTRKCVTGFLNFHSTCLPLRLVEYSRPDDIVKTDTCIFYRGEQQNP